MPKISKKEMKQFELLKKIYTHTFPDKFPDVYFICGEGGSKNDVGLPTIITVCPAYGCDSSMIFAYQRIDKPTD